MSKYRKLHHKRIMDQYSPGAPLDPGNKFARCRLRWRALGLCRDCGKEAYGNSRCRKHTVIMKQWQLARKCAKQPHPKRDKDASTWAYRHYRDLGYHVKQAYELAKFGILPKDQMPPIEPLPLRTFMPRD
jgi:hypothetical protein